MNISFGKFIPVRVFVENNEIKSQKGIVPKEVERATLILCDCLSKNEKYPDTYLAEQQRRYFNSKISDYNLPKTTSSKKSEITPSSVKTLNLDGVRYLVTGDDIRKMQDIGHDLGKAQKNNYHFAEDYIGSDAENMSHKNFEYKTRKIAQPYNDKAKQDRLNSLRRLVEKNKINETLYIRAFENENAKLAREKYEIALIDFKA